VRATAPNHPGGRATWRVLRSPRVLWLAAVTVAFALAPLAAAQVTGAVTSGFLASPVAGAATTGFLAAPTDQLSVPGMLAGAEVTPEGDLYTGWAEYELRFGRRLAAWNQPTRTLPDPSVPLLSSTLWDGAMRYTQTLFAIALDGVPVAYDSVTVRDDSSKPGEARLELGIAYTRGRVVRGTHGIATGAFRFERPTGEQQPGSYEQPGQPFSAAFRYSMEGRDLDRSGLLLARGPALPSRALEPPMGRASRAYLDVPRQLGTSPLGAPTPVVTPAPLVIPTPLVTPTPVDTPTTMHDARLFTVRVGARGQVTVTWQIPLEPPPAGAAADRSLDRVGLTAARRRLERLWRREEAGMMKIAVPERRVGAAYEAALAEILGSRVHTRAGWMQATNKLQYQELWIRDATLQLHALDLAGLHRQAAQDLSFMDAYQQPDGLFISRPGQYDGWGQALWALDQHAQLAGETPVAHVAGGPQLGQGRLTGVRLAQAQDQHPQLTGGTPFARAQLGRVQLAIGWLSAVTALDPLGLLPAADPGDDELAFGHITGDDLWAAAGLRAAIEDAEQAGRPDLATAWRAVDSRFESSLDGAIEMAVGREGHIPPVLDAPGGLDWGNYYAAYPVEVLSASSAPVRATLAWARAHMDQGLATYKDGASLHDYLGFSVFETELAAGDRSDAVGGLYSELAHTTSTYGGWEWGISSLGYRGSPQDLSPHGTFAADYVALLRNMLVAEAGDEIRLLSGASPAWLGPGERIGVSGAPTDRGLVSFTERASAQGELLRWSGKLTPGTKLTWVLPPWARDARGGGLRLSGSTISLHGARGSVSVTFVGRRPAQSYARAVAALDTFYERHGLLAPLVPAPS
jgi:hypothetical protein